MPTLGNIIRNPRRRKTHTNNVKALKGAPHRKAFCVKVRIVKPKKPNSAQRKIVRLRLTSAFNGRRLTASIPGQGHSLKEFSTVLVSGGRANDVPGVRYTLIKGKFDFDYREVFPRVHAHSKYGRSFKMRGVMD